MEVAGLRSHDGHAELRPAAGVQLLRQPGLQRVLLRGLRRRLTAEGYCSQVDSGSCRSGESAATCVKSSVPTTVAWSPDTDQVVTVPEKVSSSTTNTWSWWEEGCTSGRFWAAWPTCSVS